MRKKKYFSWLALLLAVSLQITAFAPPAHSDPPPSLADFITSITITDRNGDPLPAADISKSEEVRIRYDFAIPNTAYVTTGDTYTMQVPDELEIIAALDISLDDTDGNHVADVHIATDGQGTIRFTEYAATHSNVSGYFYIDTRFDQSEIGNANPITIRFTVAGQVVDLGPFFFEQPPMQAPVKSGVYDPTTNTITWTVIVNNNKVTVNNAIFSDTIPADQTYLGSPTISPDPAGSFNYADGTLTYTFPATIQDKYTITFQTRPDFVGTTKNYFNQAVLTHDAGPTPSNNAQVTAQATFISKNGTYDAANKKIDWTVTINPDKLPLTGTVTVTDDIPAGLSLIGNSVYLQKEGEAAATPIPGYADGTDPLVYTFPGSINDKYTLTFSTTVAASYYETNQTPNFDNTAVLTANFNGNPISKQGTKGVGVGSSVIKKEGAGYNRASQEITWRITVNGNNILMGHAQVTDAIPAGQEFVAGSVTGPAATLRGSLEPKTPNTYYYDAGSKTLTFNFADSITTSQVVTFKTKVTDPNVTAVNGSISYSNKVILTRDGHTEPEREGTQTVTSQVIAKTGGDYNHLTRQLTWQIVVNQNQMLLPNAKVRDIIPAGQTLVANSVTWRSGTALPYTYDQVSGQLDIDLGTLTAEETIELKTLVDPSVFAVNNTRTLENKATLTNDFGPAVETTGTKDISNTLVGKIAHYTNGNLYIDWDVTINANWLTLTDAKLTDVLPEGLVLDTDMVKLYKQTVDQHGVLAPVNPAITLGPENVSYDPDQRRFVFTLPSPISDPYLLTFRTDVTDRTKSPFVNTISFDGTGTTQTSSSGNVTIVYQGGGGGAAGNLGSIKVVKVDAENLLAKLSAAVFELLDRFKNVKLVSNLTGSNGEALFTGLKFDTTYYVREKTAPAGYHVSNELYEFQLHNQPGQRDITYNFENHKIYGSITVVKVDAEDHSRTLPGAVFELLAQDQATVLRTSAATGNNGEALFDRLDFGTTYYIREKTAPDGYYLSTAPLYSFTLSNTPGQKDIRYEFANDKIYGSITVVKVDSSDPTKKLPGAVFALLDQNRAVLRASAATGNDGEVVFDRLLPGTTYYVQEQSAPAGYYWSSEQYAFQVHHNVPGQLDITYEFRNTRISPGGGGGGVPPQPPPTQPPTQPPVVQPEQPPVQEVTDEDTPKEGNVEVPSDGTPNVGQKPGHGTVTVDENGKWIYTPDPGFVGKDKFSIIVIDEQGVPRETFFEIEVKDVPLGTIQLPGVLPKTGERDYLFFYLAGSALLLLGIVIGLRRKRA